MSHIRVAQVMGKMVGGGVEAVVMNYYRHIDHARAQFDFIVDSDSTLVPRDEIESLGGRVFEVLPYQKQPKNSLELERLFQAESWPIVHSHMNSLSLFPLRAAKRSGVPVRIAHSHSTWGKGEWKRNVLKALLRTQSNRYPTHRMACGQLAGDWLFGKNSDYTVLRNAVEMKRFIFSEEKRLAVRRELGIAESTFVVGHLGRFMTQKNHQKLIDVFSEVRTNREDAVLLLAGSGPLENAIRTYVHEIGLDDSVVFLGQRSDSDALYSAFDCFCLPSLYEGLPVVSVEAQMAGLPLVMSDAVSSEASITKRCATVPLKVDDGQWAEVILASQGASRFLDDEDQNSLAPYDIERSAPALVDYYSNALGDF